jgi:hypothetical protein
MIGDARHTLRVAFDSIIFIDDVFYRRHYTEETVIQQGNGETSVIPTSNELTGAYGGSATEVTFRAYGGIERDNLAVMGTSLVRTRMFFDRTLVLRYDRRP